MMTSSYYLQEISVNEPAEQNHDILANSYSLKVIEPYLWHPTIQQEAPQDIPPIIIIYKQRSTGPDVYFVIKSKKSCRLQKKRAYPKKNPPIF